MAKLLTILIFSTILNSFLITFALSKKHSINEVINVLANMVDYFKKNYQSLNFEAHFGLRVVEGQLKLLLSEYNEGKHRSMPANVMTQLRYLSGEAAKTANMAVPHLLEYDRRAFTSMRYQVEKPWLASHNHRLVNTHLLNVPANAQKPKEILEDDRNICGAELTGTNNQDGHKCATTLNCLQMMSAKGQRGFSLQHQIFYTALAEQVGCASAIDDYLASLTPKTNLEQLQRELCSNAYYELLKTVEFYGIQPSFANLFLLIEFNCPSLGFFQFLTDEWLDLILTWQNSNGCISGANEQVTEAVNQNYKNLPSRLIVQQEEPINHKQEIEHEIYKQNFNQLKQPQQDDANSQVIRNDNHQENANSQVIRNDNHQENANSPGLHDTNDFPQQNTWFPMPNPHFANVDYANSAQTQNKIVNSNIANQLHQHLRLSGAEEIAHAHVLHNNQNDVHEVVHNDYPLVGNHNFDIPLNHENGEIKTLKRRSLLEVQKGKVEKVDEDDDHGYFFDRDKHIGGNSSEQRVYMYQYPMHEQMKRMMEFKERQQIRKAERQHRQHSQHLTTRKLLKDTSGNCNVQLTGLAACALTMYVRFMVDPGPPEFHNLRLNKPEGQYDFGVKESEENDPDEPLFVPNKQRILAVNGRNVDKLYPLRGGFQPLYFGDVRKKLHPEEDDEYVRKAESPKNLVDKAFDSGARTFDDSKKNISNIHRKTVFEKENKTKISITTTFFPVYLTKSGRISAFNKAIPTELGYHLLLIIVISLVCVIMLFRYFRFKRRVQYRTKYI